MRALCEKAKTAAAPGALLGDWRRTFAKKETDDVLHAGKHVMRFTAEGTWELYEPGGDPAADCVSQAHCWSADMSADASMLRGIVST